MKCTRVENFLALHVAGDLTGRRARAVTEHLTTCGACRHAAAGYDASRKLLRAGADSLPAEFDSAFYEEIRNSVLAQIKGGRTPAPPPLAALSSFFNGRFAYAASLALIVIAASLSWHSYTRRTEVDGTPKGMIANANHNLPVTPGATAAPKPVRAISVNEQTSGPSDERAGGMTGGEARAAKSLLLKRRARSESEHSRGAQASLMLTRHMPSHARRNRLAPNSAGTRQATSPQELATGGDGTKALTEVSRIEIQTSDPNIRIIWLAPNTDSAPPLE